MSAGPNPFRDGSLCPDCGLRPKTNAHGCGPCLRKARTKAEKTVKRPALTVMRRRAGLTRPQAKKLNQLREDAL